MTPQPRRLAPAALSRESIVEGLEALGPRDGDQEVPPDEADQSLDLAFVVALARPAEPVLEQIVGLKFREDARSLPLPIAQDAGDCQLGVVVQDGAGDAAEERNRRVVAIAERLGRLRRVGLHEAGITVGKIEGKEVDLARHAADHRHRLAEVRLGVAGGMDERHEHLARPKPPLTDIVLHDGVAAGEPVLVPETVEDPLRRVPLLVVAGPIVFQNPIDDPRERTQLRPPWRLAAAIPRRHRERQHLAYRLAVQPEHPRGLAGAHSLDTTRPPDPRLHLHPIDPPAFQSEQP